MTSKKIDTDESAAHRHARFLSALAHELRTPLGSVLILAEMMVAADGSGNMSGRTKSRAGKLQQAALDMRDLIDQVAQLARIESGRVPVDNDVVAVDSLASQINQVLRERNDTGPWPEVRILEGTPGLLHTDRNRLAEIVSCLVGDVVVDEESAVKIVIRREPPAPDSTTGIVIDVCHAGVDLPANRLEAIFEPFQNAFKQSERHHGGQSLRLTIAHALSHQLGGILSVRQEPEGSLTFQLVLPP